MNNPSEECQVCVGTGNYPIITRSGETLYYIRCPECHGTGKCEPDELGEQEPPDWPPASTAARIKSIEQLRTHLAHDHEKGRRE